MASRWKNLVPINDRQPDWFESKHLASVRHLASAVQKRTGCECWHDRRLGDLCFGYDCGGDTRLVFSVRLYLDPNKRVPNRLGTWNGTIAEDDIVWAIQAAKQPESRKQKWRESRKKLAESDAENERQTFLDSHDHRIENALDRSKQEREMGRHFRPKALVDGLKG